MKQKVTDRRRRRRKAKLQTALVSIALGGVIGSIAGLGAIESHKNWELQKQVAAMERQLEDRQIESVKLVAGSMAINNVQITELTDADLAEQDYYDSLEMLAQLVEAEAGNQSLEGKRLVVATVLNRVDSPDFPNTIEEVILQENQFACIKDGGFERAGWRMQDEDYKAVILELSEKTDSKVLYFTAGNYGQYGTPAYRVGDHYFSYK